MEYTEISDEQRVGVLKSRLQGLEMDHLSATVDRDLQEEDSDLRNVAEERIERLEGQIEELRERIEQSGGTVGSDDPDDA